MNTPTPARRVLVVEDDDPLREVVSLYLRAEGYVVEEAREGAAALDLAARVPVDLVVLDLIMPGVDGYAVLRRFQADEQLRRIPVLVTTGTQVDDPEGLGAAGLLQKPFDMGALVARLRALEAGLPSLPSA